MHAQKSDDTTFCRQQLTSVPTLSVSASAFMRCIGGDSRTKICQLIKFGFNCINYRQTTNSKLIMCTHACVMCGCCYHLSYTYLGSVFYYCVTVELPKQFQLCFRAFGQTLTRKKKNTLSLGTKLLVILKYLMQFYPWLNSIV